MRLYSAWQDEEEEDRVVVAIALPFVRLGPDVQSRIDVKW
jgi:hypothetical protein